MKIYMHIGNYKTGTTAVQNFLFANREKFADLGYFIPLAGRMGDAHHAWAGSLIGRPDAPDAEELYREINEELANSGCDKAIVSTELFFNGKSADEIAERLPGHEIVVIAYLRRQDEFASAFYMQLVKHPNFMESGPPDVARAMRKEGAANYLASVNRWARTVGQDNMIIRPYEASQLPHGLMHDFLKHVGVAPDEFPGGQEASSVNVTIETELIEYLRIANGLGLSQDEHAKLLHGLSDISQTAGKSKLLHKKNAFSPQQRREILAAYEDDNSEIARTFLGREDGILFYAPPPDDDASWQPMALSVDALAQITAALWILQQKQLSELVSSADREFFDRLVGFLHGKYISEHGNAMAVLKDNEALWTRVAALEHENELLRAQLENQRPKQPN